jgi:hypothetical protein
VYYLVSQQSFSWQAFFELILQQSQNEALSNTFRNENVFRTLDHTVQVMKRYNSVIYSFAIVNQIPALDFLKETVSFKTLQKVGAFQHQTECRFGLVRNQFIIEQRPHLPIDFNATCFKESDDELWVSAVTRMFLETHLYEWDRFRSQYNEKTQDFRDRLWNNHFGNTLFPIIFQEFPDLWSAFHRVIKANAKLAFIYKVASEYDEIAQHTNKWFSQTNVSTFFNLCWRAIARVRFCQRLGIVMNPVPSLDALRQQMHHTTVDEKKCILQWAELSNETPHTMTMLDREMPVSLELFVETMVTVHELEIKRLRVQEDRNRRAALNPVAPIDPIAPIAPIAPILPMKRPHPEPSP